MISIDNTQIINNKFHLNCARIELTQNTQVNPLLYNGSGIIYQNQLGEFIVEFIHIYKESSYNTIDDYNAHYNLSQPCKEIKQEFFFNMTATDLQGQKWNSEKIIFHNNQIPTDYSLGKAIKVRVPYISRNRFNPNILPNVAEDKNICKNYSTFIIRGQLKLPYNIYHTIKDDSSNMIINSSLSKCNLTVGERTNITIQKFDELYTQIEIINNDDEKFSITIQKIIEALSIASGQIISPVIINTITPTKSLIKINSFNKLSEIIFFSIINWIPNHARYLEEFITNYIKTFDNALNEFYTCWYKMALSRTSSLDIIWLTTSVALEGLANHCKNMVDLQKYSGNDFQYLCDRTKEIINKSTEISKEIKPRLLDSIAHYTKLTPKNILKHILKEYNFDETWIIDWQWIRNKSAHDNIQLNQNIVFDDVQDRYYSCLNLFFTILMIRIQFSGVFRDFKSKDYNQGRQLTFLLK